MIRRTALAGLRHRERKLQAVLDAWIQEDEALPLISPQPRERSWLCRVLCPESDAA